MTAISVHDPFLTYRAWDAVNSSWLKKMEISALAMKVNADLPQTRALILGRLNHLCTLEYPLFHKTAVVWGGGMTKPTKKDPEGRPTMNKNSTAFKEFEAEVEAGGGVCVDQGDYDLCETIRGAIHRHPVAGEMLRQEGDTELSIYWDHPMGVKMKSRIDALSLDAIMDLKFVRSVVPREFMRAVITYGWDSQAAMYQDAVEALTGEVLPYYMIAAEKTAPFDVVVFKLPQTVLDLGRSKYTRWLEKYVECDATGVWPGISSTVVEQDVPEWAYLEADDGKVIIDGVEVNL